MFRDRGGPTNVNVYASDYPGALLGLMPTKVVQQQSNGPTLANAVKIALGDTLP
jgi:hypothetical protein